MADGMKLSCLALVFVLCLHIGSVWGACPQIISHAEWSVRNPTSISYMSIPVHYAFIHHSAGDNCMDRSSCIARVQEMQNYHMDTNGWNDIGYSFVIGGDGSVFEGRGWDTVPAGNGVTGSYGYGFVLTGNFMTQLPTQVQLDATKDLIGCAVMLGKLESGYTLRGHRDASPSITCPGDMLYAEIQTWPHY